MKVLEDTTRIISREVKEITEIEKKIAARQQTKKMFKEVVARDLLPRMSCPHRKQSRISSMISPTGEKKESYQMTVLIDEAKNVIDKNAFVTSVKSVIIVYVIIGHARTGVTPLVTE